MTKTREELIKEMVEKGELSALNEVATPGIKPIVVQDDTRKKDKE